MTQALHKLVLLGNEKLLTKLDILGLVHVYTSLPDNSSELLEGLYCLVPKHNYVFMSLSTKETIHACVQHSKLKRNMAGGNFPHGFTTSKESTVLPLDCITVTKKVTQA